MGSPSSGATAAPPLTFADFADTPLTSETFIVSALPPGLSLVSITGIIPFLAAMEAELSASQDDPWQDLNQGHAIATETFVQQATLGVEGIFNPNTGESWNRNLPSGLNTLNQIGTGAYWFTVGSDGGSILDVFFEGIYRVNVPETGFYAFPYTGPAGPPTFADDVLNLDSLFVWRGFWESYTPGAPDFVNAFDNAFYGTAVIGNFSGSTSFDLDPAGLTIGDCAAFLPAGEDNLLVNPMPADIDSVCFDDFQSFRTLAP